MFAPCRQQGADAFMEQNMTADRGLLDLWESSTGLLTRFGLKPQIDSASTKLGQELEELASAIEEHLHANWADDEDALLRNITEETIDVMVTMVNLLNAYGVSADEFNDAWLKVKRKNDAKNLTTHEVYTWPDGTQTVERIGRYETGKN